MSGERLDQQLHFLMEIDRLKQVERQTAIIGGSRRENTAEHSWHLAMYALILH
ncbi:MAG: HD domain-containing protein, partial [Actinomycetota bacterium]